MEKTSRLSRRVGFSGAKSRYLKPSPETFRQSLETLGKTSRLSRRVGFSGANSRDFAAKSRELPPDNETLEKTSRPAHPVGVLQIKYRRATVNKLARPCRKLRRPHRTPFGGRAGSFPRKSPGFALQKPARSQRRPRGDRTGRFSGNSPSFAVEEAARRRRELMRPRRSSYGD